VVTKNTLLPGGAKMLGPTNLIGSCHPHQHVKM